MHEHKFNASLVDGHGRCSCGAWGRYKPRTGAWTEVTHPGQIKGLETRLKRLSAPATEEPLRVSGPDAHLVPRQLDEDGVRDVPDARWFRDPGRLR